MLKFSEGAWHNFNLTHLQGFLALFFVIIRAIFGPTGSQGCHGLAWTTRCPFPPPPSLYYSSIPRWWNTKQFFPPLSISPIFPLPLLLIVSAQTNKSSRLKNKEREREERERERERGERGERERGKREREKEGGRKEEREMLFPVCGGGRMDGWKGWMGWDGWRNAHKKNCCFLFRFSGPIQEKLIQLMLDPPPLSSLPIFFSSKMIAST